MNILIVYSDRWMSLSEQLKKILGKPGCRFYFRRSYYNYDPTQYEATLIIGGPPARQVSNTLMYQLQDEDIQLMHDEISKYIDMSERRRSTKVAKKISDLIQRVIPSA